MSEKRDRDPFETRYDSDGEPGSSETSKTSKPSESSENSETSETVRDRKNVNMYLPDQLVEEMNIRYSELNARWMREHGEELPKNQAFYPAILRAALGDTTIEEELGLDE